MSAGSVAIRAGLAVIAGAAIVWLALGLRASRLEERGIALAPAARTPAQVAEARDALVAAQENNADTRPLLLQGELYIFTRQPARAIAPLQEVVRREPENEDAWVILANAADVAGNRALAARARARALALSPPVHKG